MNTLFKKGPLPRYYQLKEIMREKIRTGEWKPGDLIPSERELGEQYGISRMTARQAITELVNEGLFYREQGKGTFVSHLKISQQLIRLTGFTEDIRARGQRPATKVLSATMSPADENTAERLRIKEGQLIFCLRRLRLADGEPLAIEQSQLHFIGCERLLEEDLEQNSLYRLLETKYGVPLLEAEQELEAGLAGRRELHAQGTTTDIIACDLADPDAVTTLIHHASHHHPLHMIIHAAVALDDGVLDGLTPDSFARVARAKILGAWHLHESTAHLPGCALVLFSSVAGTVGGAGQGNYAASNAFLDGLAAWRRAQDLPTMVVAWGAWAGGGSVDADLAVEFERRGIMLMPPADALAALDGCLADGDESVLIANLDWPKFHSVFTATRPSPLIGDMIEKSGEEAVAEPRGDSPAFRDSLASLSANQAEAAVRELVRDHAATALGHADSNEVDTTRGFNELGFTSLTSVELRNRLVAATGVRLPVVAVYDHPNVTALARYLLAELSLDPREGPTVVLREIERLASFLRKTDRTADGGEEIDRKLADLVDVWRAHASGDEGRSALDDDDILQSETVDDVFQILRDEFGRR